MDVLKGQILNFWWLWARRFRKFIWWVI